MPSSENDPGFQRDNPLMPHYLRRHSHDVRNCLAAMDLQTMLLQHSYHVPEGRLTTLRRLIGHVEETQLRLGIRFQKPTPADVALGFLLEQCQSRQRLGSAERQIAWSVEGGGFRISVDAMAVSVIVAEIADHFFAMGGGSIIAKADGVQACLSMERTVDDDQMMRLTAADAEAREELISIVARHAGELKFDAAGRKLTLSFPVVPSGRHQPPNNP
jgi:hypothetical protein